MFCFNIALPVPEPLVDGVSGGGDVEEFFKHLQEQVDFDYFAVTNVSPLHNSRHQEVIKNLTSNFPSEWVDRYTREKLFIDDPVFDFATMTTTATDWRQLEEMRAFELRHKRVLNKARNVGIRSGVFMSTRHISGHIQLISFANSVERRYTTEELQAATMFGHLIGNAFSARFCMVEEETSARVSAREIECLSLSAVGKSSADIEVILGISRHTADFHLKNVMAKLDATSRTFAIVKAIRLGIINP